MITSSPGFSVATSALKITCLPPGADVDLRRRVGQAVLARELGDDGLLELGHAVDVGVFGLAALDGGDGGVLDVVGRVEVRLAGAQADDVATRRASVRAPWR